MTKTWRALFLLLAASCTQPRTEIILRINTDMQQGPGNELPAIRVRVFGQNSTKPEYDRTLQLGSGSTSLPASMGLIPSGPRNSLVSVEIDVLDGSGATVFTKRASANYVPDRTKFMEIFLANRCLQPANQTCPSGESCGQNGCELDLRSNLPDFTGAPPTDDGGMNNDLSVPGDLAGEDLSVITGDLSMSDFANVDTAMPLPDAELPDFRAPVDLQPDLSHPDLTPPSDDLGPTGIPAPQPIEPISSGFTTSNNVRFRWKLTAPADGARLEICGDRACADVRQTQDVTGTTTTAVITPTPGSSRVFFYRLTGLEGATVGSARSPVWEFSVQGLSPAITTSWGTNNDFDGDGFSDVIGGAPASSKARLFRGRSPVGGTPLSDVEFSGVAGTASSVFGAGDSNGDGFADIAIGNSSGTPSLLIYHGRTPLPATFNAAAANVSIPLPSPATRANAAAAGDINGDGYGDLVIGDPGQGRILVLLGGFFGVETGGTPLTRPDVGFGTSVAGGCDVNADGFSDVIVGGNGNATVLFGSGAGLGGPINLNPPIPSPGPSLFGASVACAGDVNADGYADVIVGAPGDHSAFIYHGTNSGPAAVPTGILRKIPGDPGGGMTNHGESFGATVASAGDLNADGYSDVVVSAPDIASGTTGFVGYVFTFHGRPGGLPSTAPGTSTTHQRARGASVSGDRRQIGQYAGDVNGDGIGDLITGAPTRNSGGGSLEMNIGIAYTPAAPNENLTGGPVTNPTWDVPAGGLLGMGTTIAWVWPTPRGLGIPLR